MYKRRVFVDPVAANMGVVAPAPGFLEGLRAECSRVGALLVFDEVITGFRLGSGGAQGEFGVSPDLTTFGKVIGGGPPLGAGGGRRGGKEKGPPPLSFSTPPAPRARTGHPFPVFS